MGRYPASSHAGSGCDENKMVPVQGGEVTLGKPKDFPSYGWDNEYGEVKCRSVANSLGSSCKCLHSGEDTVYFLKKACNYVLKLPL